MRILHVIASFDAKYGGPPVICAYLAAAQAKIGPEVGLEAGLLGYDPESEHSSVVKKMRAVPGGDQVRVISCGPLSKTEYYTVSRARPTIENAVGEYDLIHINGVWDCMLWAAAAAARRAGKPYAITLHGMLDPWTLTQGTLKKKIALALVVRRFLDGAAFLHLGNTDEESLIKPLRLKARGEIIPNGVFLEEFAHMPPRGAFYAKHPELKGQPFILFLSRLHYKKGLDYLADAFAIISRQRPDLRLVVAGPDGGYKETFEQMIAAHGLTEKTHLVGPQYGEDKLAAFVDAACFCLPSRQEGFSIAITESLACGTPTVVTKDCHYPEVERVGAGLCTALNAPSVAEGVLKVLAMDARQLGTNGQHLIRTRFNWPAVARRSVECYSRVLSPSPPPRG
jgi:glycosyltransferase involved in cell wall biosynthesis